MAGVCFVYVWFMRWCTFGLCLVCAKFKFGSCLVYFGIMHGSSLAYVWFVFALCSVYVWFNVLSSLVSIGCLFCSCVSLLLVDVCFMWGLFRIVRDWIQFLVVWLMLYLCSVYVWFRFGI